MLNFESEAKARQHLKQLGAYLTLDIASQRWSLHDNFSQYFKNKQEYDEQIVLGHVRLLTYYGWFLDDLSVNIAPHEYKEALYRLDNEMHNNTAEQQRRNAECKARTAQQVS